MIPDLSTYSAAVRLDVEGRPEALTLVRSLLAAVGDALGLEHELVDDLRTAVSEACNNVVLHAYDNGPGPLMVSLIAAPDGLRILVRDSGRGMHRVSSSSDRMGVGLAVISALADRADFRSNRNGGTDVRMWFINPDGAPNALSEIEAWEPQPGSLTGEIAVSVAPLSLLGPVLGRVTRAAAAQSRFTADGIAEIGATTDAIAAHATALSVTETVDFSLTTATRRLEVTAGPFVAMEVIMEEDGSDTTAVHELQQPMLEQHGDRHLLRTVIVDERLSA